MPPRYPWLWDTDLDNEGFETLLRGQRTDGTHDDRWAIVRLIEYAPFKELKRLLPRKRFLECWPEIASRVRSETRRRGMEFFHHWLHQRPSAHG
jgi:hypothetical protein